MQKFDNKIGQNIHLTSSWKNLFLLFLFWCYLHFYSKEENWHANCYHYFEQKIASQIVFIILIRKNLPIQHNVNKFNLNSICKTKNYFSEKKPKKTYLQNNSCPSVLSYQFCASLASRGEKSSIILTVALVCPFSCFKDNHSHSNTGLSILVF